MHNQRWTMNDAEASLLSHKTWRTLEPLHGMIYFAPEAAEEYEKLGITGRDGYFASRAAPMGGVSAEVVIATFFNFNPELVRAAVPAAWDCASPDQVVAARFRAVDRALQRLLGWEALRSPEMRRASELARRAADTAIGAIDGRPLCAGHAGLAWPDEPHLVLWHAQSILREFRGDGHVALLMTHGLTGIQALITHAAQGDVPASVLQSTRGWSDSRWHAAIEGLQENGWLSSSDPLALTEWGGARRADIEAQTDLSASTPYVELGVENCAELRDLARPWSRAAVEGMRAGLGTT
jgi:hypothetical protein